MNKVIFLIVLSASSFVVAQKPIFVSAKAKAATVYFNSAEITQTTSALLPKGTTEIVVKNVSNSINESTIRISAPSTVTVLSVQFTNNYFTEYEVDETNPIIKKVRDSISLIKKEIQKVNNSRESDNKAIELLDKNQQISGVNLGLNVTELIKMVEYYKMKRTELRNNLDAFDEKSIQLNEILARLNARLEIKTQKQEKSSAGKLIIQLMNQVAGITDFEINYLTTAATWKPFYDLRANTIGEPIEMLYKAEVKQETGLDWKNVKLTLASGNPNQSNQAPIVNPWFLSYQNREVFNIAYDTPQIQEMSVVGYGKSKTKNLDGNVESVISNYTSIVENQLNISFDIQIPYDILSNGKAHSVSLKEIKIPATFKYFAAPKFDKEAFLMAEVVDYSKFNLLNGDANIIFEGMYVGKTTINTSQTTDTLSLSMGRDKKIAIKRDKVVDKSGIKFLSSRKEQTFTFDTTIRNNKKEIAILLLKDQYPLSSDKEIEIELMQSDGAKIDVETGILSWDLSIKPGETKKIRISYKVKYAKDRTITNL